MNCLYGFYYETKIILHEYFMQEKVPRWFMISTKGLKMYRDALLQILSRFIGLCDLILLR